MKTMRKVVSTLLLVCMLATMLAAGAYADGSPAIRYTLTSEAQGGRHYELTTDKTLQFQVEFVDPETSEYEVIWYLDGMASGATGKTFTFDASKYSVGSHTVQPKVMNNSTLTQASEGAAVSVTVSQAAPTPESVVFTNVPANYLKLDYYGNWGPVQYVVYPTGCKQSVTWKAEPEGVAYVDPSTGIVHAIGKGTAVITATSTEDEAAKGSFTVEVTIPTASIAFDKKALELKAGGDTGTITATVHVGDKVTYPQLSWTSSDYSVAVVESVNEDGTATIKPLNPGTAVIKAVSTDGTGLEATCTVNVSPDGKEPEVNPDVPAVIVTPVNLSLVLGESKNISASIVNPSAKTGTKIDHWYCTGNAVSYAPNPFDLNSCTIKAVAVTSSPIEVRAYAADGSYGYAYVTVSQSDALELGTNANTVKFNGQVTVSVLNARNGESFNWSYTPMDTNIVSSSIVKGNSLVLTAGAMDGTVTVTATSKLDASRTASVVIGVNGVDPYGTATITPKSVNWKYGDGDLVFQIQPACYWAYLDNQYLNTKSTSLASYWNGALTLKQNYLASLSVGTHTLKVYTAFDEYNNPTGLVYANIYITSNGSVNNGSGTLASNSHIKGTASNLYFNSAAPVSDVYISGKWIDPANYSLSSDGMILTLNSNFLNQLAYGTYTMTLNSSTGSTQTTNFRIVTQNYAPATGDEANIALWLAIMILSGAGALALIPRRKKSMQ